MPSRASWARRSLPRSDLNWVETSLAQTGCARFKFRGMSGPLTSSFAVRNPMRRDLPGRIEDMRWQRQLAGLAVALFAGLNFLPHGPVNQSPEQNPVARHQTCTEKYWGFPFPIYSRYGGGGYVSPLEFLPWDVDPIWSQWHPLGIGANIASVAMIAAFLFWVTAPKRMNGPTGRPDFTR
jgi:hypothetical protein